MPVKPKLAPVGKLAGNRLSKREAAVLDIATTRVTEVTYDFSRDGGAVGFLPLKKKLPKDAVLLGAYAAILTPAGEAATLTLDASGVDIGAGQTLSANGTAGGYDLTTAGITREKLASPAEIRLEISGVPVASACVIKFKVLYTIST